MPALPPYIPNKDAVLANWATNFRTLISAAPGTYGLLSTDATAIAAAVSAFTAAYTIAINPATRTPVNVANKDVAKINMLAIVRPYAVQVSLNAGVLVSDKINLRINPRTSTPAPITVPTTNPVITIDAATTLAHIMRFRDTTAAPSVKAKPYGVTAMLCFASASSTPITNPDLLSFKEIATKGPLVVSWEYANVGQKAYYAGRWQTRTGLLGPWSPIVSFTIAA